MRNRTPGTFLVVVLAAALSGCDGRWALTAPSAVLPQVPAPTPVGRLSGEFTLTLTPDATCDSLPNELRTRSLFARACG